MPELDGFELAAMIRDHPRFQKTAIIFISADPSRPMSICCAAMRWARSITCRYRLCRKCCAPRSRYLPSFIARPAQLEQLNRELERRVAERTAELEASNARLQQSEQGRSLALAAGQMGSWDWDLAAANACGTKASAAFLASIRRLRVDVANIRGARASRRLATAEAYRSRHVARRRTVSDRIPRASGRRRIALVYRHGRGDVRRRPARLRISGVTIDITDRKEAEARQALLAREVDHRARNALAVVQSIVRLTRANSDRGLCRRRSKAASRRWRGRTRCLSDSRWHGADLGTLVAEELAPYRGGATRSRSAGRTCRCRRTAQGLALALHELATNAAKHGALSSMLGKLSLELAIAAGPLVLQWTEAAGRRAAALGAQLWPEGDPHQHREPARRQGGFDWAPPGMQCICDPARETWPPRASRGRPTAPARRAAAAAAGRGCCWSRTKRWSP